MSQAKKAHITHLLSERLRKARTRLGLTQQGLAALTGFSLSAIGNWESRQNIPSPAKLGAGLMRGIEAEVAFHIGHSLDVVAAAGTGCSIERQFCSDSRCRAGISAIGYAGATRRPAIESRSER